MTPLQAAQLILGDTSLLPLKEWEGLNGELGVTRYCKVFCVEVILNRESSSSRKESSHDHTQRDT
ncbi:hypothetical protein KSC_105280 [Ktedonobacter sp. SOSP1-52]|nr:hypothetical protein KSC_105280 [Ktedonobacter sp. SOSP1-52]